MEFHGASAQVQLVRHRLVGASGDEQHEHIPLASGQRLEPVDPLLTLAQCSAIISVMIERLAYARQQGLVRDRLLKIVKRSLQHSRDRHRNPGVTGDEDERNERATQIECVL